MFSAVFMTFTSHTWIIAMLGPYPLAILLFFQLAFLVVLLVQFYGP